MVRIGGRDGVVVVTGGCAGATGSRVPGSGSLCGVGAGSGPRCGVGVGSLDGVGEGSAPGVGVTDPPPPPVEPLDLRWGLVLPFGLAPGFDVERRGPPDLRDRREMASAAPCCLPPTGVAAPCSPSPAPLRARRAALTRAAVVTPGSGGTPGALALAPLPVPGLAAPAGAPAACWPPASEVAPASAAPASVEAGGFPDGHEEADQRHERADPARERPPPPAREARAAAAPVGGVRSVHAVVPGGGARSARA